MDEACVERAPAQDIPDYKSPISRMSHAAGIYGGCLVVHGGYTGQEDQVLNDVAIFDIAIGKWVRCK